MKACLQLILLIFTEKNIHWKHCLEILIVGNKVCKNHNVKLNL